MSLFAYWLTPLVTFSDKLHASIVTGIIFGYNAVTWGILLYGIMISSMFHQDVQQNLDWSGCIHTYLNDIRISYVTETLWTQYTVISCLFREQPKLLTWGGGDDLRTVFVLTTGGASYEWCLYWQLEESAMNGVCIDNLRSQLWTVFVWTTWGVSYEWCLYGQFEEPAMHGVCMDNLRSQLWTVFVWTLI